METCRKIASPHPPVEDRQPLRLAIEANSFQPPGGLIALIALLALILLAQFRLFTRPLASHQGLSSLCSHMCRLEARCLGIIV